MMLRFILCSVLSLVLFHSLAHASDDYHFIAVSDIHFDPFLACHQNTACPLIDKLTSAPVSQWDHLLNQYDHSLMNYGQDTNSSLLNAVLDKAGEVRKQYQPAFVILLGDMLAHHYRRHYRQFASPQNKGNYSLFVRKSMLYLAQKLSKTFPNMPLYFAVGNNDSYTGNYSVMVQGSFFNETSMLWQSTKQPSFQYAGYYAVETPGLRMIVLNTNLFSKRVRGREVVTAAQQQLKWLQTELTEAQKNKQQVFILMHIPEGIDLYLTEKLRLFHLYSFWQSQYIAAYHRLIGSYANTIAAVYSGHLHTSWSGVVDVNKGASTKLLAYGIPSISPFFGQNPSFQLFSCVNNHQCSIQTTYSYILSGNPYWS